MTALRAVGAIRLSRYHDESTSQEVQEEMISSAVRNNGARIVGWARDIDVSALKTSPWERPELREWLDHPGWWDMLTFQRMDRAVRNMRDMEDLGRYAEKHNKKILFASGPGGAQLELDFTSPVSRLIMTVLAFAAELEGQTIMERTAGTAAYLQSIGRHRGGVVPYGYQTAKRLFPDGNEGWWLELHTETAAIRREMVSMATTGKAYAAITDWLNASKAITPLNHRAILAGRETKADSIWMATAVRAMLKSPVMRGYAAKEDGEVLRDATGAPVMQGEPLIDDPTWYTLQEALSERDRPDLQKPRRKDAHPLLGVLVCGACGRNLQSGTRRYMGALVPLFRCSGRYHKEGDFSPPTVDSEETVEWVRERWLRTFGRIERVEVVRMPGVDYSAEIADLGAELDRLEGQLAKLDGAAADAVIKGMTGRSKRIDELKAIPSQPPHMVERRTGETWAEAWEKAENDEERRQMMLSVGALVAVGPVTGWRRPVGERLSMTLGNGLEEEEEDFDA